MNKYIFIEPINTLPPESCIFIGSGDFHLLNVLRAITGSAKLRNTATNKEYKLDLNLTYIPIKKIDRPNAKKFIENFQDLTINSLSDENIIRNFMHARHRNREFYKIVEKELIEAILSFKSKNYIKSFLFIYRLIETISFTTPLIFLSKNSDYFKTYDELKKLFNSDESIGELGFFKKFILTLFKNDDYLSVGATLDFKCINDLNDRSDCIQRYEKYMTKKKGDNTQIEGLISRNGDEIVLQATNFHEFFINFRNRFFHNLKGSIRENLQATDIFDTELFFKPIVTQGLNHIGLILFKLIEKDLEF